jgi:hypothetical protein
MDMRSLINLIESIQILNEFKIEKVTVYGVEVKVFINPSNRELLKLCQTAKEENKDRYDDSGQNEDVRGLIDKTSGDLYVWNGFDAPHMGMRPALGLKPISSFGVYFEDYEGKVKMTQYTNNSVENLDTINVRYALGDKNNPPSVSSYSFKPKPKSEYVPKHTCITCDGTGECPRYIDPDGGICPGCDGIGVV